MFNTQIFISKKIACIQLKNLFYLRISDGAIACSPLVNSPSLTGLIGNFDKKIG